MKESEQLREADRHHAQGTLGRADLAKPPAEQQALSRSGTLENNVHRFVAMNK
jgi:hypothetical protein